VPWWDGFDEGDLGAPLPPGPYPREYDLPGREPGITPYTPPAPEFFGDEALPPPPPEPLPPQPAEPIVHPPGPTAPPEQIGGVDFGAGPFPDATGWPLERLPSPFPRWPRGGPIRYETGPDWEEIYNRMEAERYKREGYDFWEFAEDKRLDPDEAEFYWPRGPMGFVARPRRAPNPLEVPGRMPPVYEPGFPFPRRIERRARPPQPSRLPEIFRRNFPAPIPEPLPSERNPNRVLPPGIEIERAAPPEVPAPELPRMPQPRIPAPSSPPAPQFPAPSSPPAPRLPTPRAPRRVATPKRRTAAPRWPRVAGPAASAASILRRYIVRQPEPEQPRFLLRDFLPEVAPQPVAPPPTPQIAPPAQLPEVPDLFADLTPLTSPALPFAQPATRRRQDEPECREDETEEEAEERREANASNVIADVKSYRRRMSQNSLDNLE